MRLFLDTNILVDILARREPFYGPAMRIDAIVEAGKAEGLVSTVSMPTVFYLLRRLAGADDAYRGLDWIISTYLLVPCDCDLIRQARQAQWKDFEDAIQYFSARRAGAACLITRDEAHFEQRDIPILSPEALLRSLSDAKD